MAPIDWTFLAVLLVSMLIGAWRGLVYELLSLAAWVVAFFAAQWGAAEMADWLPLAQWQDSVRYAVGFAVVFVLAVFACGFVAWLAKKLIEAVGLRPGDLDLYPHEFSGGQRQRIAIARALISQPQLIVADEPVSALDVSVQAQVLNLLQGLQQQGISLLLISHDLRVVQHLCDQVCVLYRGEVVEYGPAESVLRTPAHPYTQKLLAAAYL